MPINAYDFLDALDLPSEHPYTQVEHKSNSEYGTKGAKEWSISSYFSSVSWKDWQSSPPLGSNERNDCEEFPSPPWGKLLHGHGGMNTDHMCRRDLASLVVTGKQSPTNPNDSIVDICGHGTAICFLQEIKPCLVSMCRMQVILWAPLLLLICLRRLSTPPRRCQNSNVEGQQNKVSMNRIDQRTKNEQSSDTSRKYSFCREFLILSVTRRMPSFSNYLPSLPSQDQRRRQSSESNQNNSFEKVLFLISLIANAMSLMASCSAIFHIEEEKKEVIACMSSERSRSRSTKGDCVKSDRQSKILRTSSTSNDDLSMNSLSSSIITGDWLTYVITLIFSAFVMTDAMYVYEFSRATLVALHLLVIFISMKRFGSKVAVCTALPISALAFYVMGHQDLNLPPFKPGLYYNEDNAFISEVVREWPVEKRTYDDGRGTPWTVTGDTRTGVPFLLNPILKQEFTRRLVYTHAAPPFQLLSVISFYFL